MLRTCRGIREIHLSKARSRLLKNNTYLYATFSSHKFCLEPKFATKFYFNSGIVFPSLETPVKKLKFSRYCAWKKGVCCRSELSINRLAISNPIMYLKCMLQMILICSLPFCGWWRKKPLGWRAATSLRSSVDATFVVRWN